MNKYLKILFIVVGVYFVLLLASWFLMDRGAYYSPSYSFKFCSEFPMNCLQDLLTFSPEPKSYGFTQGIVVPCIEQEGIVCPKQ